MYVFCVINFYAFHSIQSFKGLYICIYFFLAIVHFIIYKDLIFGVFLQDISKSVQTHGLKFGKHICVLDKNQFHTILFQSMSCQFPPFKTRKNCFRYLKLMSPLNAAICTTIRGSQEPVSFTWL